MPRGKYNVIKLSLLDAQHDREDIENQLLENENTYLDTKDALYELRKDAAALEEAQSRFEERHIIAQTQKDDAISDRDRDIQTINEYMDLARKELEEEIRQAEEIKAKQPKAQLPLMADLDKLKGNDKKKAAEDIFSVLKTNAENANESDKEKANALADYFKNLQTIDADRDFLELDNHSSSNAKHKTRSEIRNFIKAFNKAKKKDSSKIIDFDTFKHFGELAAENMEQFKSVSQKIKMAISDDQKLDAQTKEAFGEYVERFESYCVLNAEQGKLKDASEKEINKLIGLENASRKSASKVFDGNIPTIDELDKLKAKSKSDSLNGRLAELYQVSINDVISQNNENESMVSITNSSDKQNIFKTIEDYYSEVENIKQKNKELHFEDKGEYHNKRAAIRGIIEEYNSKQTSSEKKLPENFAKLTKLNDKDPVSYSRKAEIILNLIENSGKENAKDLEEYFESFDEVKKGETDLKRGKAFIDDAIKKKNEEMAAAKKDYSSQKKQSDEIEAKYGGELNADNSSNYFIKLNEISERLEQDFQSRLSAAEDVMNKAEFKKGLLDICGKVVDKVSDLAKECAITLCLSQIKGELRGKEENITTLKTEIEKRESFLKTAKRLNSAAQSNIARDVARGDIVVERSNEGFAINSSQANMELVGNAQRNNMAETAQQELSEMRIQLEQAEKEYKELTAQKKEQAKDLLLAAFGEKAPAAELDSDEMTNVNTDANRVFNFITQIESEISKDSDTHIADVSSVQEQINRNYKFWQDARKEAGLLSEGRENDDSKAKAESMSEKVSKLFTESNLTKVDKVVSVVETAVNTVRKLTSKNKAYTDISVEETLASLKAKAEELNNPEAAKEHTLNRVVDIVKEFSVFLENTNKSVKNSVNSANFDFAMAVEEHALLKKEAEELKSFKADYDKKSDKEVKSPNYIYNYAKHILNPDEAEIEKHNENIKLMESCAKKADEMAKAVRDNIPEAKNLADNAYREYTEKKPVLEAQLKEKNAEIEKLENDLHKEKKNIILEESTKEIIPCSISKEELADKKLDGVGILSKLSGVAFGEKPTENELRAALDKIYINGITASQFLQIDNKLSAAKDEDAVREKFGEIGRLFKECFEETLSAKEPKDKKTNILTGQIIAVENENFMLCPVQLTSVEIENAPNMPVMPVRPVHAQPPEKPENMDGFFKRSVRKEYERALQQYNLQVAEEDRAYSESLNKYKSDLAKYKSSPYYDALEYNAQCAHICKDFNNVRIEAAKAEYDKLKTFTMNKQEKQENVRRIKLDEAFKLSAKSSQKNIGKTKAVSSSKEHNSPEKQGLSG